MARLTYIFIFVLTFFVADGQPRNEAFPAETVVITTNATGLLAGETLYYTLFCLNPENNTPSQLSRIGYVELIDSKKSTVARQKIRLYDTVGSGDVFLPTTLPSGSYKLIGYTKYMIEGSNRDFFEIDLKIVNPFQKFEGTLVAADASSARPNTPGFSAATDKSTYRSREKVSVKFPSGTAGRYAVSVKKRGGFAMPKTQGARTSTATSANILPELRGEVLTGSIISKSSGNLAGKNVALSIPGKSFGFKIVQTDRAGRFVFVLDQVPDHSDAVVQVMEPNRDKFQIVIDENARPDYSNVTFPPFQLTEADKSTIADRTIGIQVENAYFDLKRNSIAAPAEPQPFFHPLEKVYALDDYTRFPSVRETIIEVVKEMYFTKHRDKYDIHLRNTTMNNEQFGQALVLVDGLLIQDYDALFAYGAKGIESVSLINEPYVYGPKTFSGVANFSTKLGDFKDNAAGDYYKKISLERPQPAKQYFTPDYTTPQPRIPDYRHQLLWMPDVSADSGISFYTSDITGTFEIIIDGFSADGAPVFWTGTFDVK